VGVNEEVEDLSTLDYPNISDYDEKMGTNPYQTFSKGR